ncbi:hypothetical protein IWX47DRAFT_94775, partial [Phyllosticta citricarpa]
NSLFVTSDAIRIAVLDPSSCYCRTTPSSTINLARLSTTRDFLLHPTTSNSFPNQLSKFSNFNPIAKMVSQTPILPVNEADMYGCTVQNNEPVNQADMYGCTVQNTEPVNQADMYGCTVQNTEPVNQGRAWYLRKGEVAMYGCSVIARPRRSRMTGSSPLSRAATAGAPRESDSTLSDGCLPIVFADVLSDEPLSDTNPPFPPRSARRR